MTRAEQILKIKAFLDEMASGFEGLTITNDDPKPLDTIIDSVLDSSVDEVYKLLPLHLLSASTLTITPNTIVNGVATLALPNDYLKLAELKYASWTYPATKEISEDNPLFELQLNPYTRGGKTKPVVVKMKNATIEAYTVTSTDTATGKYIAHQTRVSGAIATFTDNLSDFVAWFTAAKIAQIFQNDKAAAYCMQQFNGLVLLNTK
jgi:hypothetical protein